MDQRAQRKGAVAQPTVAIVPVAATADLFGQRGGQRRDDCAGGRIGHGLQREQRALHLVAPRAVVAAAAGPGPPPCLGLRDAAEASTGAGTGR